MIAQYTINVLMLGGVYGILAAGFSLVYGVLNILNVAHGAFVMIGGYLTFTLATVWGLDPLVGMPFTLGVLFVFGYLLQKHLLNRLSGASIFMVFVFTFGLDMVLANTAVLVWTPAVRTMPSRYAGQVVEFGGVYLPVAPLIVVVGGLVFACGLFYLLWRTRLGLAIQATALHADSARLVGVDVRMIYAITFAIAAALGGAAGSLLALVAPLSPFMGVGLVLKAFVASVLGGLGNVPGAMLAGLILAIAEVSSAVAFGSRFAQLTPYLILLIVLTVRPRGLFGREYFAEVRL